MTVFGLTLTVPPATTTVSPGIATTPSVVTSAAPGCPSASRSSTSKCVSSVMFPMMMLPSRPASSSRLNGPISVLYSPSSTPSLNRMSAPAPFTSLFEVLISTSAPSSTVVALRKSTAPRLVLMSPSNVSVPLVATVSEPMSAGLLRAPTWFRTTFSALIDRPSSSSSARTVAFTTTSPLTDSITRTAPGRPASRTRPALFSSTPPSAARSAPSSMRVSADTTTAPGMATLLVKSTVSASTVSPVSSVVPANTTSPSATTVNARSPLRVVSISTPAPGSVAAIVTSAPSTTSATSPAAAPSTSTPSADWISPYSAATLAAASDSAETSAAPSWMAPAVVSPAASRTNVEPVPRIMESVPNLMSPPVAVPASALSMLTAAAVSVTRAVSTKSMSPPSLWMSPPTCASLALTVRPALLTVTV